MRRARPRQSFNAVLNACCRSSGFAAAEQWFQKTRQAASVERGSLVNPQKIKGFPTPGQRQHPQQRLSMNFFGPQHLITEMSLNHRYPHLPHLFSWSILERRVRLYIHVHSCTFMYIHVHSCTFVMLYQCRMFQN
jgi:hypothetical protein